MLLWRLASGRCLAFVLAVAMWGCTAKDPAAGKWRLADNVIEGAVRDEAFGQGVFAHLLRSQTVGALARTEFELRNGTITVTVQSDDRPGEPVVVGTYVVERRPGGPTKLVVTPSSGDAAGPATFLLNPDTGIIIDPHGRTLLRRK